MSTFLGSNLSELDRLLLELNAVQQNPPGFPADEANSAPPLPGALSPHYGTTENSSLLGSKAGPPTKEKPKRNGGRGLEDVRPSVESLLDELESSVPSPVPAVTVTQGEVSSPQRVSSSQQHTRISASSATRELDELMASLSDFKTSSSAVALSSLGLLPSSAPSPHHAPPSPPPVFLPSTTVSSSAGHSHTLEVLCIKDDDNGQGLPSPEASGWLDLAGLGLMAETPRSKAPSGEGSLGPLGTESRAQVCRDPPHLERELSRAPLCHTLPPAGCPEPQEPGGPQGPPAHPVRSEEAEAATWEHPWSLEVFRPGTPCGAAPGFQEVTEPAVAAIFPDTWSLTKECGQFRKERARPQPGGPESSCPGPVDEDHSGGGVPVRGSPVRPAPGPDTPGRPPGAPEAATEAEREQPKPPAATAPDTPSAPERISTARQLQGLEQRAAGELCGAASWPLDGRQSSPEGQDEGGFMNQGRPGSSSPPGGPPKPGSQLDSMLGSLQSDLNKLGVATVAKGVCGACKKPIAGQVVTAMGKTWHPEHFVCSHCQEEIGSRNFFERDGQPYCEKDYHNLFSPRCCYCNGPILDKVVTALDRTWHPEHFFCAQCGAFFGPEGFHEKDGKAYCRKDYFDMFAPKCGGCARAILENYISALNTLWHPECFVCRECFTPFVNGSFFEHDGQPYCEVHYHERRGSLCSGCQKPITGRCITAMAKKFHPEHFVCAFCLKQLNKGTFKEQNDKPYCQNCFLKLFC
ncbi:PREDICTED: paxillin isoform X2 [Condylura cristata]|uniref:paxillin isoform X2 n=1 Tax=Condylura cristata TaxID=143302 RepID=UPI000643656F|nr:PREDICTED: paxillin isoform X2 [Condylura cristata]